MRVLGHGGMAGVELWQQRNFDQDLVVAKKVYLAEMSKDEEKAAREEAKVLKRLKHPNIVKYMHSWMDRKQGEFVIVQEYCQGGDLAQLIKAASLKQEWCPADRVLRWFAQLAHALQFCHRKWKILHRDLKPGNVFLSETHVDAKLGDFGIAKCLGDSGSMCNTFIGTHAYMSPEVLRLQQYGLKSDVWGLGTIFYEVCALRRPFEARDAVQVMQRIVCPEGPPPFPEGARAHLAKLEPLCGLMLTKAVEARPTLGELLRNQSLLQDEVREVERVLGWEESLLPQPGESLGVAEEARLLEPLRDPDTPGFMASPRTTAEAFCAAHLLPGQVPDEPPPPPAPGAPARWELAPPEAVDAGGCNSRGASSGVASGSHCADSEVVLEELVRKAADVKDLQQLTLRRGELECLMHKLTSARPPPAPVRAEDLPPGPMPPPTPREGHTGSEALQAQADIIDARLHCLGVLQAQERMPDAIELVDALRRAEDAGLDSEDCGQALAVCAQRLCMHAVDVVADAAAPLHAVEGAAEILETIHRAASAAAAAAAAAAIGITASASAPEAGAGPDVAVGLARRRLQQVHEAQDRVTIRSVNGHVLRLLSVPRGCTCAEFHAEVAQRWQRPEGTLHLIWRDEGESLVVETEEMWRLCLRAHPEGAIEVFVKPKPGQPGFASSASLHRNRPQRKAASSAAAAPAPPKRASNRSPGRGATASPQAASSAAAATAPPKRASNRSPGRGATASPQVSKGRGRSPGEGSGTAAGGKSPSPGRRVVEGTGRATVSGSYRSSRRGEPSASP